MTDTVRTIDYLTGTSLADGQPVGSITPQDMRDVVVTLSSRSFISVGQYGAIGDGVTDDTAKINAAYAALVSAGGGYLVFPHASYGISGAGVVLDSNVQVTCLGKGTKLQALSDNTTLMTVATGFGNTILGATIEGFVLDGKSKANVIGLLIQDSDAAVVKELFIQHCTTGILFQNNAPGAWCERDTIYDTFINACTTGIDFEIVSGNNSFNEDALINVGVTDCPTGIKVGDGANMIRTNFQNVTVWVNANQTGISIGASYFDSARWMIGIESFSSTGSTGVNFSAALTGDQTKSDVRFTFTGSFATQISNTTPADLVYKDGTTLYRISNNITQLNFQQYNEAYPRLRIYSAASGTIDFGTGSDTTYHSLACTYNTSNLTWPGKFLATGGIGVGNSVAASAAGTLSAKIQVFDQNGSSIGYLPVYTTIT